MLQLFKKWGRPQSIKTDNGDPFGVPTRDVIPVMSLWLIGWGITPILNRPRHPQDNAKVERAQGTSSRWAEIEKATNAEDLQERLDIIIAEQRDKYPVKRLKSATRAKVFPEIYDNKRLFDDKTFDIQATYAFLSSKILQRKVSSTGIIALYSKHLQVHQKFKGQYLFLKFNAQKIGWDVVNCNNDFLKFIPDERFAKDKIILLTVCQ